MQPDRQKQQDEANKAMIQSLVEWCAKFQRTFSGKEPQEVLGLIKEQVPEILFNENAFIMAKNVGKKELLDFILNGLDDKKLQKKIEQMKKMCKENK